MHLQHLLQSTCILIETNQCTVSTVRVPKHFLTFPILRCENDTEVQIVTFMKSILSVVCFYGSERLCLLFCLLFENQVKKRKHHNMVSSSRHEKEYMFMWHIKASCYSILYIMTYRFETLK